MNTYIVTTKYINSNNNVLLMLGDKVECYGTKDIKKAKSIARKRNGTMHILNIESVRLNTRKATQLIHAEARKLKLI